MRKNQKAFIALSARRDGSMRLGRRDRKNREKYLAKIALDPRRVISAGLAHSNAVRAVSAKDAGKTVRGVDGLVTKASNLFLSATVADCLPIFLHDPKIPAVGILHAGWRGLATGIIGNGIAALRRAYGSTPENIRAFVGAGIGPCHYEVKKDVAKIFQTCRKGTLTRRDGKIFLDLQKIARQKLLEAGLPPKNIKASDECTSCRAGKYFSHRQQPNEGVMLALIGMR